jgi:hypothetical protein
MQANITGTASSGAYTGSQTRVDLDPAHSASSIVKDVRDGAIESFSTGFVDFGDALVAARWKTGSSVSGSISVDNSGETREALITLNKSVIGTVLAGQSGGTMFSFSGPGDTLSVEHGQ